MLSLRSILVCFCQMIRTNDNLYMHPTDFSLGLLPAPEVCSSVVEEGLVGVRVIGDIS